MSPFTIHVNGKAVIPHPAERALINVVVASSGTSKQWVSDEVITTAKHVEGLLRELSPKNDSEEAKKAAPLAHWSKTSLSATSHVPRDRDGNDLARKYHATVTFDIRFRNFEKLGSFGTRLSVIPHVEVNNIQWILTNITEKAFHSQLRKEAARDALQKAEDYAEVLGCKHVKPVELSEAGLSSHAGMYAARMVQQQQPQGLYAQTAPGSNPFGGFGVNGTQRNESGLDFRPEEVTMSLDVTAKFHAE